MSTKKRWLTVLAALTAVGVLSSTAFAVLTTQSGSTFLRRDVKTETTSNTYSGITFSPLPGAAIAIGWSSGTRLISATFSAESVCDGGEDDWCSTRIIVRNNSSGAITELHPQASLNFAFDTANLWGPEAHSMSRMIRLGAGSWTFYVQRNNSDTGMDFTLDDWLFQVDQNA